MAGENGPNLSKFDLREFPSSLESTCCSLHFREMTDDPAGANDEQDLRWVLASGDQPLLTISKNFDRDTWRRGEELWRKEPHIIVELAGDKLTRTVSARCQAASMTGMYEISLTIGSDGQWNNWKCSCPQSTRAGRSGHCKHAVALLLQLNEVLK